MITFLPPDSAKRIVLETAVESGMPGCSATSLYDARPHMRALLDALYSKGYVFCELADGQKSQQIANSLSEGKPVKIQ